MLGTINLCFDNRDSLHGDDDDGDDDDDTSAISTCAVKVIHDVVAEICRKTGYMTMLSCLIYFLKSNFIYIHFLMLQSENFSHNCLCMVMVSKLISFVGDATS